MRHWRCVPDGLPRGPSCRLARAGRPRLGILNAGRPTGCRRAPDRRRQKRLQVLFYFEFKNTDVSYTCACVCVPVCA
ncbi:MAG: hypothetical protein ACK55Z_14255, partial [bacterium]